MPDDVPSNYGSKERGYVQPYSEIVDDMIDYIDTYAVDEPSIEARRKMMKDAQVKAVVEMLKEATISTGWELHYDWETDKELGTEMVNFLYEAFNRINEFPWSAGGIEDLLEKCMDALWYKKSVTELVLAHDRVNEYIFVKKAKVLPPESIKLPCDSHGNLLAIQQYPFSIDTSNLGGTGKDIEDIVPVELDMSKVLLWVNGDDYSQFEGKSELDSVYKYWFLKDFILKFWSMFVERFGAPLLIAFVKSKNMKAARDGLKTIVTETGFALEQEDKLEIVEPKKEGQVFTMMINYCDNEITKGLLVPTLLLGSSDEGGSKSLGDMHFKLFEYRVQFIQRKLQNLMRALIKKMIDLNFNDVKHYPVFTFKPFSLSQRRMMAQTFDLLIKNALVHPLEPWIRRELQLPEIDKEFYDDLDQAWKAKMSAGSQQVITTPTPGAAVTRTEAQTPQREPTPVGQTSELAIGEEPRFKKQFDAADLKFANFLVPRVHDAIEGLIKTVDNNLKNDRTYAKAPDWLKSLKFSIPGFSGDFSDMYDEILVDITLEDNSYLSSLGMKSALDVKTRTGAFKWIDSNMSNIRNGLMDYGSANANDLEARILRDTKDIIQKGIDEGLRGRDIVKNLSEGMIGGRYNKNQLWAVVRTNTTSIINQGKKGFARANVPFVKGMRFQAVLDDNTTQICEELNGHEFAIDDPELDKYTPSLHFECRSGLDYITEGNPQFDPEGINQEVPEGFGDGIYALGND